MPYQYVKSLLFRQNPGEKKEKKPDMVSVVDTDMPTIPDDGLNFHESVVPFAKLLNSKALSEFPDGLGLLSAEKQEY